MTAPENPEPRPTPAPGSEIPAPPAAPWAHGFPPTLQTFPRMGRAFRWSDLVAEMIAETGAEGDHLSTKEEAS